MNSRMNELINQSKWEQIKIYSKFTVHISQMPLPGDRRPAVHLAHYASEVSCHKSHKQPEIVV